MGIFTNFVNRYSKSGRNLRRKEYSSAKYAVKHRISSLKDEIEFRKKEDPRQQAHLKQSMFGRGLGKSTIMEQDKERLSMMQKMRNEALKRQLNIAWNQLSIIKKQWKLGRRMQWAQTVDNIIGVAGMVLGTYGAAGSAGGAAAAGATMGQAGGVTSASPDYGGGSYGNYYG